MRMCTRTLSLVAALAISAGALVLTGCEAESEEYSTAAAPAAATASLPQGLVVSAKPEGAQSVNAVKAAAKEGDEVVMSGIIGGAEEPLAANRAIFTMIDPALTTCDEMSADMCKTPWDACCEPREKIVAQSATVQVAGTDGQVLKSGLNNVSGIAPLKNVTIKGKVRSKADQVLVVDATAIHVE